MLDLSASNLADEMMAADAVRDDHVSYVDDMLAHFAGPASGHYQGEEPEFLENHYYEYVSLMLPRVVFDNPRVRVQSRAQGSAQFDPTDSVALLGHALNRWVRDTKLRRTLLKVMTDMLFCYGVTLTTQEPRPGREDMPERQPQISRIPFKQYGLDPLAQSRAEARFEYHTWHRDKTDLLREARRHPESWDIKVIEGLATGVGMEQLDRDLSALVDKRKEIVGRTIWVPEYELEKSEWKRLGFKSAPKRSDGFHGALIDVAVEQGNDSDSRASAILRPARPYYGHRSGPYQMYGVYYVPGSPYPLSPLVAVEGLVQSLNDMSRGVDRSCDSYKRFIMADAETGKKVKNAQHDTVVIAPGFDASKAQAYEVGGPTEAMLAALSLKRARLDRGSGVNETMRGNVTGEGTATENMIADEAGTTRVAFVKQQATDATADNLVKVGFLFWTDERTRQRIDPQDMGLPGGPPMVFEGGPGDGPEPPYDELEIEIEPYSMERTSEGLQQRRAQLAIQMATEVVPVMAQFPNACDWKDIFNDLGDSVNMPGWGERFSPEGAAGDMQAAAQGAQPQQQGGDDKPQKPRFSVLQGGQASNAQLKGAQGAAAARASG